MKNIERYDYIEKYDNGLIVIMENNKWGIIDKNGFFIIPAKFDWAHIFKNDFIGIFQNFKWAFFNNNGKQLTNFEYDKIYSIQNSDRIWVKTQFNENWIAINRNGNIVE